MKHSVIAILLSFLVVLAACGGGNNSGNINGNWTAALTSTTGGTQFAFTTNITEVSGSSLSFTNFRFTTSGSCFTSPTTETGSFVFSGDFNGNVTGQYQMTISTEFPSNNNVLTLTGGVNGNTVSGTWTLTGGAGCTGNGTFTMNRG